MGIQFSPRFVYDTHDLCVRAVKRLRHINCNFFFSVVCVSFMHIKFQVDKLLLDSHTMKGTTAVNFNLFIQSLVYFYRRRSWLILCFVLVFAEHCTFSIHSIPCAEDVLCPQIQTVGEIQTLVYFIQFHYCTGDCKKEVTFCDLIIIYDTSYVST